MSGQGCGFWHPTPPATHKSHSLSWSIAPQMVNPSFFTGLIGVLTSLVALVVLLGIWAGLNTDAADSLAPWILGFLLLTLIVLILMFVLVGVISWKQKTFQHRRYAVRQHPSYTSAHQAYNQALARYFLARYGMPNDGRGLFDAQVGLLAHPSWPLSQKINTKDEMLVKIRAQVANVFPRHLRAHFIRSTRDYIELPKLSSHEMLTAYAQYTSRRPQCN